MALLVLLFSHSVDPGLLSPEKTVWSRLPHHVKIGNTDYPIRYVLHPNGKMNLLGVTVFTKDRTNHDPRWHYIEVAIPEITYNEVESTVIHEILHAISREYHFKLPEKQVLELEQGLFATFKQNGWQIQVPK